MCSIGTRLALNCTNWILPDWNMQKDDVYVCVDSIC